MTNDFICSPFLIPLLSALLPSLAYVIIRRGYGAVYRARHKETGFTLAIKMIDLADEAEKIMHEIDILKKCRNANIVSYYGSVVNDRKLWVLSPSPSPSSSLLSTLLSHLYFSPLRLSPHSYYFIQILMDYCSLGSICDVLSECPPLNEDQVLFSLCSLLSPYFSPLFFLFRPPLLSLLLHRSSLMSLVDCTRVHRSIKGISLPTCFKNHPS